MALALMESVYHLPRQSSIIIPQLISNFVIHNIHLKRQLPVTLLGEQNDGQLARGLEGPSREPEHKHSFVKRCQTMEGNEIGKVRPCTKKNPFVQHPVPQSHFLLSTRSVPLSCVPIHNCGVPDSSNFIIPVLSTPPCLSNLLHFH